MRRLTLGILLLVTGLAAAKDPPKGFVPFFNGKDLTGWHGMPHFDPYALAKMGEADRTKLIAGWTADAAKHWSVKDGDLVNDGDGAGRGGHTAATGPAGPSGAAATGSARRALPPIS